MIILLAGLVAGYLVAAAATGEVAVAMACTPGRAGPGPVEPGPAASRIMGKLTL